MTVCSRGREITRTASSCCARPAPAIKSKTITTKQAVAQQCARLRLRFLIVLAFGVIRVQRGRNRAQPALQDRVERRQNEQGGNRSGGEAANDGSPQRSGLPSALPQSE